KPPEEEVEAVTLVAFRQPAADGKLRLERARLSRLSELFPGYAGLLAPLAGSLTLGLDYRYDAQAGGLTGSGSVRVRDLRYGEGELADELRADLVLSPDLLRVRDINGTFGEGRIRASLRLPLRRNVTGGFSVTADRVDAGRLLRPLLRDGPD